jgi:FlaA1/EpsC-like NDP-sugar epimerase
MPARSVVILGARRRTRKLGGYLIDLTAFGLAGYVAFALRFDGALPVQLMQPMHADLGIWAAAKSLAFLVGSVRWVHWRYTSTHDVVRIVLANSLGSLIGGLLIVSLWGTGIMPRSVYVLDWLVACILTLGVRLAVRLIVTAHLGFGSRASQHMRNSRAW